MSPVLSLIAILALVLLSTITLRLFFLPTYPRAFIVAFLAIMGVAQLSAEMLSTFSWFKPQALMAVWLSLTVAMSVTITIARRRPPVPHLRMKASLYAFGAVIALVVSGSFLSGLLIAPANYDSLTYSLPRAMHWLQQGGLWFFETPTSNENFHPPLSSILFANLLVAAPQLELLFIAQWLSGIVLLVGVALAARQLAGPGSDVAFGVLFVATLPMFVVMMSTTQQELMASVPLAGIAVSYAELAERRAYRASAILGLSLGLSLVIKPTSVLALAPLVLLFGLLLLARRDFRPAVFLIGACAIFSVALAGPFLIRFFLAPSGEAAASTSIFVSEISLGSLVVSTSRNAGTLLHTPSGAVNDIVTNRIVDGMQLAGFDPNSPAITYSGTPVYSLPSGWSDNLLGAPVHVIFALGLLLIALLYRKRSSLFPPATRFFLIIIVVQFVLISITLKWAAVGTARYLFVVLVMLGPLVASLVRILPKALRIVSAVLLSTVGIFVLLAGPDRGLTGSSWLPLHVIGERGYPSLIGRDPLAQMGGFGSTELFEVGEAAIDYALTLRPDTIVIQGGGNLEFPIWWVANRAGVEVSHVVDEGSVIDQKNVVMICLEACPVTSLESVRVFSLSGPGAPRSVRVGVLKE